jgi:hypothetical protein
VVFVIGYTDDFSGMKVKKLSELMNDVAFFGFLSFKLDDVAIT